MDRNKIDDSIRNFITRAALELVQGARVKPADKDQEIPPEVLERMKRMATVPENVEESLNNPYINREGIPLAMDIFKPIGPEYDGKELPVIVSIHGGGLVTGDRKISQQISRDLASRGYLVFALEYRLAPRATVCEQFDDVCAGMDLVGKKLVNYDVDFSRVFMIADSAGALLAIYTAAMKKSKKLQEAIGYEPGRMVFKALGLSCGMFYTNRNDVLGQMLSDQFYGDKLDDEDFLQYMNPEHPEIINNLPPTFLVTSRGDFLNNYTIMYEKALKNAGNTTKMLYYPGEHLPHTFNFSRPWLPESKDANDKMLAFFEEQADIARVKLKNATEVRKQVKAINKQMEEGKFADQKMWEAVMATNGFSSERMDTIAIIDDSRKYTYRQMFRKWDEYAEVFTALRMAGKNNARVGIPGGMTTEAVMAFYALNKLGTSVSMIPVELLADKEAFFETVKDENITDLILTDFELEEEFLTALKEKQDELEIDNVIILDTEQGRQKGNLQRLKRLVADVEDFNFMSKLLVEYEATPVYVPEKDEAAGAIILHKRKSDDSFEAVEFTNEELNAFTINTINNTWEKSNEGRNRMGLTADLSMSLTLAKQVHFSLLLNHTLVISKRVGYNKDFFKAIEKYQINMIVAYSSLLDTWMERIPEEELNFSSLDQIRLEDTSITKKKLASYQEYLDKQKGKTVVNLSKEQTKDYSRRMMTYGKPDKDDDSKPQFKLVPASSLPYVPGMVIKQVKKAKRAKNPVLAMRDARREGRRQSFMKIIPAVFKMLGDSKKKKEGGAAGGDSMSAIFDLGAVLFSANNIDYYFED